MGELSGRLIDGVLSMLSRVFVTLAGLFKHYPLRVLIFVALIASAALTGRLCASRSARYQDLLIKTVKTEGEPTPQRFKVLEAFIMAALPSELRAAIQSAPISDATTVHLKELAAVMKHSAAAPASPPDALRVDPDAEFSIRPQLAPEVLLSRPDYVGAADLLTPQTGIITDRASAGYLFLPLNMLRQRVEPNTFDRIREESRVDVFSATLTNIVAKEPIIADDIAISSRFLHFLERAPTEKLLDETDALRRMGISTRPIQAYYITQNGVARFVDNANLHRDQLVQRNIYRGTTHFPSRPYFVEAMKRIGADALDDVSGKAQSKFYVSLPYMDIGGVGVVVTLAIPVSYPGHSDGVLCFDLAVLIDDDMTSGLRAQLDSFEASSARINCTIRLRGDVSCTTAGQKQWAHEAVRRKLADKLNEVMKTGAGLSTLIGELPIVEEDLDPESPEQAELTRLVDRAIAYFLGSPAQPLTFAIPVGAPIGGENAIDVRFFVSSLNFGRFQQVTILLALLSVSLLAVAFFIAITSWHVESRKRLQLVDFVHTLDDVQQNTTNAYCRLDEHDRIVDCNAAMYALLGAPLQAQDRGVLRHKRFESLLAPTSIEAYRNVRELRKQGGPVPAYKLTFRAWSGDRVIDTLVTSAAIPSRVPGEPPQSFGFIVPLNDSVLQGPSNNSGVHRVSASELGSDQELQREDRSSSG